jgi:PKD repeat protein
MLLLAGCGGHSAAQRTAPPAPETPAAPLAAALPGPAELIGQRPRNTSVAPVLERTGAATDPALAPQHAAANGPALAFSPDWPSAQATARGLAYALYRFNVTGYSGETSLHFAWNTTADLADLKLLVADFTRNRWTFYAAPADGTLLLSPAQFTAATDPATQDLLVVPLIGGTAPWELASVRIGPEPQSSIVISSVQQSSERAFTFATFFPVYSGGAAHGWTWDFGGAGAPGTAVGKTPSISLGAKGSYNATVTALDANDIPAVYHFSVTVKAFNELAPHLYGLTPNSGDTGTQVTFTGGSNGGPVASWSWDFGGGAVPNTSTATAPKVTLGPTGQYAASVTATNPNGSSTLNFTLYVTDFGGLKPPNVLGVTPATGNTGAAVTFLINNAGGTPDFYDWDFGGGADPNTSSADAPQVTLGDTGLYSGTLTATNSTGSSTCHFTLAVTELAPPHLTGVTPPTALPNSQQTFAAANNGGTPTAWSWDFGGAGTPNTSTSSLPSVQLGGVGMFSGSVTATNAAGSDTLPFTLTVQDLQAPAVTAVSPLSGHLLDSAVFAATNSGGIAETWDWDFGPACAPSTFSGMSPHVEFAAEGDWPGSVTASNGAGSMTFNFNLHVGPVRPPQLSAATPDTVQATAQVSFSAQNTGGPVSWSWDFGGGCTPDTSTDPTPAVQAGAVGTYSCSVTATNASGVDTYPFTLTITPLEAPVIERVNPDTAETGAPAVFVPTLSGGPPTSYSWDFGGSCTPNTSADANPQVVPGSLGQYNASLTVSNSEGSDTYNFILRVVPFGG